MTPIVIRSADMNDFHIYSFEVAKVIIKGFPNDYPCHQVCEELVKELKQWEHIRGYFNHFDHSWLRNQDVILDAYPWCSANPFLIYVGGTLNPWRNLYVSKD